MAPVTSGHILVTGATGYIAAWVCKTAIAKGFKVTGTVRSAAKGEYLKKLLGDAFDYAIVPDIANETAFDQVVKENTFDGVLHTASPFHLNAEDPKELIDPAVKGTVGILQSIQKAGGSNVKRVVVTSSTAAIIKLSEAGRVVYTEADWNTESPKLVEEQGKDAHPGHKYMASKTLAERAAWEFVEKNKPSFDLLTINPCYVFGPIIHQVDKPESLNTSVKLVWDAAQGGKKKEDLPGPGGNYVDVRDVASAHIEALLRDVEGRFILSNGPFTWQEVVSVLNRNYNLGLPESTAEAAAEANKKQSVQNGAKTHEKLGIDYIGLEQSIKDTYESILEREKKQWK